MLSKLITVAVSGVLLWTNAGVVTQAMTINESVLFQKGLGNMNDAPSPSPAGAGPEPMTCPACQMLWAQSLFFRVSIHAHYS